MFQHSKCNYRVTFNKNKMYCGNNYRKCLKINISHFKPFIHEPKIDLLNDTLI